MILLGIVLAGWLAYRLAKKTGLKTEYILDNFTTAVLLGIIFARLTFDLVYIHQLKSFWEAFYVWQGGLVSWGGFLAGFITLIILIRRQKQPLWKWLDILGLASLLGIGIGRIGCFLAGDIPGRNTAHYPGGFPMAGYESVLTLILFLIILSSNLIKSIPTSFRFFYSILGYALIRLIIDGFRELPVMFFGLNSSQLTALLLIIIVTLVFVRRLFGRKKNEPSV